MIDTLLFQMPQIDRSRILMKLKIMPKKYAVLTLHRPGNVDAKNSLLEIFDILQSAARYLPIIYAIHPRTRKMVSQHGLDGQFRRLRNVMMIDPLGYIDFVRLVKHARFVLTDSGGIQEETTV